MKFEEHCILQKFASNSEDVSVLSNTSNHVQVKFPTGLIRILQALKILTNTNSRSLEAEAEAAVLCLGA